MSLRSNVIIGVIVGFAMGCAATATLVHGQPQAAVGGKFSHIGVVVRDVDKAAKQYADIFGVEPKVGRVTKNLPHPDGKRTMANKFLQMQINGVTFELLEPNSEGSNPWRDFLDKHGEGVHHIAFTEVEPFDAAKDFLVSRGGKWNMGNGHVNFGYIDMEDKLGFTVEILGKVLRVPPQD